ncbi:MAG: sulfite exporter TauE/SafE family protein [Oscillibacter sp.]|nr:sulfite exporter TauE/SafE family protein [Oscillibacter sp.]
MLSFLSAPCLDGFSLLVLLPLCAGVFLASFLDAIAGGGGIISVPAHLLAFGDLPASYALGTNKVSAAIGTACSTARFIRTGCVRWRLFGPAIAFALAGSFIGTKLQHLTPDTVLKYLLLAVLPVVAFLTLRDREWPDGPGEIEPRTQRLTVWAASFLIGGYDGYYGPGTGTFLMLVFIRAARLDIRQAAGGVKVINLSSNVGSLVTQLLYGQVFLGVGLAASIASVAGHYWGSGLAIRNGGRLVRPAVLVVLLLLTVKVGSELLFPDLWK